MSCIFVSKDVSLSMRYFSVIAQLSMVTAPSKLWSYSSSFKSSLASSYCFYDTIDCFFRSAVMKELCDTKFCPSALLLNMPEMLLAIIECSEPRTRGTPIFYLNTSGTSPYRWSCTFAILYSFFVGKARTWPTQRDCSRNSFSIRPLSPSNLFTSSSSSSFVSGLLK